MRVRLTKTIFYREHAIVAASRGGRKIIWDDGGVAGFGAKIDRKACELHSELSRHQPNRAADDEETLGELTVESARKRAAEVKLEVRAGGDPLYGAP